MKLITPSMALVLGFLFLASPIQAQPNRGEKLAKQYCSGCHVFTPPELLTKKSWNFLLTYMGMRMGIDDDSFLVNASEKERAVIDARRLALTLSSMIPDTPMMSNEEWKLLRQYYQDHAPDTPLLPKNKPPSGGTVDLFVEKKHNYQVEDAATTLVHIHEEEQLLLVGDTRNQRLTVLDSDLDVMGNNAPRSHNHLVEAILTQDGMYFLSIGDLVANYAGRHLGTITYHKRIGNMYYPRETVMDGLYRPTDMEFSDLNGDGTDELMICNFGAEGGSFSIYGRNETGRGYRPEPVSILYHQNGPLQSATHDLNGDSLLDIILMVGDFDEHIRLFLNRGNEEFEEQVLFKTHPAWGYASFQLADINQDGHPDIITANGDNPDADPYNTLKSYHGIRIYLNDGQLSFNEAYFYPMYGAYHIRIHDYDLDDDLDLAACSFYPDFEAKEPENFVFLEQTSAMQFVPKHHPATSKGRWMTMDAGDLDRDGDIDIVLGATYIPVGLPASQEARFKEQLEKGPTLLFLENQTR